MTPKPLLQSKTIIGALLMAATLAVQFYQLPVTEDEMSRLPGLVTEAVQAVASLVGFILVIYGRIKADRPLTPFGK